MHRWSCFVLAHRWAVAFAWLVVVVGGAMAAARIESRLSPRFDVPGVPSYGANQAILQAYGNGAQGYPEVAIITLPPGQSVTRPGVQEQIARAFGAVAADLRFRVAAYDNTANRRLIAADDRATFGVIFLPVYNELEASAFGPAIARAMQPELPAGAHLAVTGLGELIAGGSTHGTDVGALTETVLGAAGALAVLVFVFGSLLALVPLVVAAVAILTTFLIVLGLTTFTTVSFIVEYLIALIGLGVAIDYSLLLVTRWREERAHGLAAAEAVHRAMATAGRAIFVSGATVAIGLCALVIVPVPFLQSVGYAGLLIPLVSAAASLTLLPVLLAGIGALADWPRFGTRQVASRGWAAWARGVVRLRWPAALGAAAVLLLLGAQAMSLRVGEPSALALATGGPATDGLRAYERAGFPLGALSPIEVLVPPGGDPLLLSAQLSALPGVAAVVAPAGPAWRRHGGAMVDVLPRDEVSTAAGTQTLARVRQQVARDHAGIQIGGPGATLVDETAAFYDRAPLILAIVAAIPFVFLTRAFRSLLLAVKAIVLNVLSIGATYGVVVLVWQEGHGSQLIWGIPATGSITNWGPLMTFAFLFGLSMDYEVFILTRIREEYDRTGSTTEAIVAGVGRTGRLVTSAALILCLAFAALSASPETDLKVVATGLGAGILLDATLVRALLVPALLALFGRWNWWLPTWLARALRIPTAPPSATSAAA